MGTVIAGIASAFVGGALATAIVLTVVGVSEGPTPADVATDRQVEAVGADDLAYGNR